MPHPQWYDPDTDPSQFVAALWKVRHLCTRAEHVRVTVPGSHVLAQAIMSAVASDIERQPILLLENITRTSNRTQGMTYSSKSRLGNFACGTNLLTRRQYTVTRPKPLHP
jgi:hypothetical protein